MHPVLLNVLKVRPKVPRWVYLLHAWQSSISIGTKCHDLTCNQNFRVPFSHHPLYLLCSCDATCIKRRAYCGCTQQQGGPAANKQHFARMLRIMMPAVPLMIGHVSIISYDIIILQRSWKGLPPWQILSMMQVAHPEAATTLRLRSISKYFTSAVQNLKATVTGRIQPSLRSQNHEGMWGPCPAQLGRDAAL